MPIGLPAIHKAPSSSILLLLRLISLLQPYSAAWLLVLSLLEAVIIARVGQITGAYYLIIVDRQPAAFLHVTLKAAGLYTAAIAIRSGSSCLSEWLAVRWRCRLVQQLQALYCSQQRYFKLQASQPSCDSPDQRMAADAALLCSSLGSAAQTVVAAPFKLAYYSWWTQSLTSAWVLLATYTFLLLGIGLQALVIRPVAALVAEQECKEGAYRYAHMRLRASAAEAAMCRGDASELTGLQRRLEPVLANQQRLVLWRWLLQACSLALDYGGALLNYTCLAVVVFAGLHREPADRGELAQWVSNASFATLTLIYTCTQLLELAGLVSTLLGLALRVGVLLEVLPLALPWHLAGRCLPQQHAGGQAPSCHSRSQALEDLEEVQSGISTEHRTAAEVGTSSSALSKPLLGGTQQTANSQDLDAEGWLLVPSGLATMLQAPAQLTCSDGSSLEASVHLLGKGLCADVQAVFPSLVVLQHCLALVTVQAAPAGVQLLPGPDGVVSAQAQLCMDRMLTSLLHLHQALAAQLGAAGHWVAAVDPKSGHALHGGRGAPWSEARAAHTLLGYPVRDAGACTIAEHPVHGPNIYPATIFTDASLAELGAALAGCTTTAVPWQHQSPALQLKGLCCWTPAGARIVGSLDLTLAAGQLALLCGPSGCGKSTLAAALAGLLQPAAGSVQLPDKVMFLPQRPLPAPHGSLLAQLVYPDAATRVNPAELQQLLVAVRLGHLLERAGGDWHAALDWEGMLSPGELQRLMFARVLYQRPALAVMDEPVAALDTPLAVQLFRLLQHHHIAVLATAQLDTGLRDYVPTELIQLLPS